MQLEMLKYNCKKNDIAQQRSMERDMCTSQPWVFLYSKINPALPSAL